MSNHWKQQGIPHKGWTLIDVKDVREDGESEDETDYESCMMCGKEKIRYVHVLTHPDVNMEFRAGCVCSEKMTEDYINPKKREKELRKRTSRRIAFANKEWKISKKGNPYLEKDNHLLTIFKDQRTKKFMCILDNKIGTIQYDSIRLAKIGLFNKIEWLKERKMWL